MGYLGTKPANAVITSEQIADGVISTNDLANNAVTAAKMAAGGAWAPAGTVLQVVQSVITGSANTPYFSTTTNGVVDTGFTATITPKFTTSKILVIISPVIFVTGTTVDGGTGLGIKRGSSNIYLTSNIAFYAGSGNSTSAGTIPCISYLDSPATTSSTTYQLQVTRYQNNGGSLVYLNRNYQATDVSTITLMEIAA